MDAVVATEYYSEESRHASYIATKAGDDMGAFPKMSPVYNTTKSSRPFDSSAQHHP